MLNIDKIPVDTKLMGLQENKNQKAQSIEEKKSKEVNSDLSTSDLSASMLSPEQTQKILNKELASKLEERFGEEGVELSGLKAEDFTPDRVADRILNFVELGVAMGNDDEEKQQRLQDAREAIEKGFGEAREILDSIGVLNGKVKEDIDKTYDLIQIGLGGLEDPEKAKQKEEEEKARRAEMINQGSASADSASEMRKTSVEVTTQDGDKVTIGLSLSQQQQSSTMFAQGDGQTSFAFSHQQSSEFNLQYQVDGELDDDEKAAIDDLITQLGDVAKDFYQGNIEEAFNKSIEIGFNEQELVSFSADMNHQQSVSSALSSYEKIQKAEQENKAIEKEQMQDARQHSFVRDTANFMSELQELMSHESLSLFSEHPKPINDLLNSAVHMMDNHLEHEKLVFPLKYNSINSMVSAIYDSKLDDLVKPAPMPEPATPEQVQS